MTNLAPMYVVTPDGSLRMDVLRILLDSELLTVQDYEWNVAQLRVDFRPEGNGEKCFICRARADWRFLVVMDDYSWVSNPIWDYLCPSCAAREAMCTPLPSIDDQPFILEPLGDGVYEPDIAIVMLAQLR